MTKAEIIDHMAQCAGISKAEASRALQAFLDCVTDALRKGQKVTIQGFGTFAVTQRKARVGRDPKTGSPIQIPETRVPRFTPGKALRQAVRSV